MRVIQKGSDIAHRLMCDTCRSILEYTSDDVKSACAVIWKYVSCTYGTTMGLPYYPKYVVCPVCGNIIHID
nr:MAG TPA: protein of unknown function (DUF3797) [Caudoviricetes sp.]